MTVDEPDEPDVFDDSDKSHRLEELRLAAGGGLAMAAGVDGVDRLLTQESSSDASLGGDTRELIDNAAAGARVGAKVGGHYGAAIGAAAGGAATAIRNK